jgi:SAM-dependent methyltransferase
MRMNWFEGYVGEDEYATGYYENLSPHFLSFVAFCQGHQAPDITQPFTFIDIASGQGISTILHAVLFPHGQFYGVDLSPAHVAKASDLAARIGLDNITFIEASVKDLPKLDIPPCDFAVAQGVYSWLNRENQAHIIEFLRQKLKARGIFSVHYMSYPGALQGEVVPQLLTHFAKNLQGTNDQRLKNSISQLEKLLEAGIGFFGDGKNIQKQISRYHAHDLKHLAHDLLSPDRKGHFFSNMAEELSHAKLSHIGSCVLHHTLPIEKMFPQTQKLLASFNDQIMQQTLRDFASAESTRRDIFQRGPKSISPVIMLETIRNMSFQKMCHTKDMKREVKLSNVSFSIQEKAFKSLTAVMKEHTFSGQDIINTRDHNQKTHVSDIIGNIILFLIAGYIKVVPPIPQPKVVTQRAQNFNDLVFKQHLVDSHVLAVAAPELCIGININNIERLILRFLKQNPKASKKTINTQIQGEMKHAGISLTVNTPDPENSDKVISTPLEKDKLDSLIDNFLKKRKQFFLENGVL